jgi:signal transduction histidine kinase
MARLEAKGMRLLAEPIQLAGLVTRAAEAIEPRLRERSLRLDASTAAEVWVTGDPDWLLQAIMNLLDNAARFSRPESAIRVSVTAKAHEAILVVEDQGAGIPERDLPQIFERFYTADRSRARPQRQRLGTGDRPGDRAGAQRPHRSRQSPRLRRPLHDPAPVPPR